MRLFPLPPPPQPPSHHISLQQPFHMKALAPPPDPTRQSVTPIERWEADLQSLLKICSSRTASQLPDICKTVVPLKKERVIAAMETAFWRTADILRLRPPCITHTVAVMVMALTFHTEDPDGVEDALNIFLLPNLFPSAGLEAAPSLRSGTRYWGAAPYLPSRTRVF